MAAGDVAGAYDCLARVRRRLLRCLPACSGHAGLCRQASHNPSPPAPHLTRAPQAASTGSRQLRAACPRLFRDIAAVLCGLRPGFMLDYGTLPPGDLASAAAGVAAALRLAPAATELEVVQLNGCSYVVRPALLPDLAAAAAEVGLAAPLMFVAFEHQPRPAARWATPAEAAHAASQLAALRQGLLAAVAQRQAGGGAAGMSVVDADSLPGWQGLVPPTASGYLLGYPALYLCRDLEGAQAAARCLSSSSLCLHMVGCALGGGAPPLEGQPLLAFSVPAELATASKWTVCRNAWWDGLQQRHRVSLLAWDEPQLAVASQAPRPVAL